MTSELSQQGLGDLVEVVMPACAYEANRAYTDNRTRYDAAHEAPEIWQAMAGQPLFTHDEMMWPEDTRRVAACGALNGMDLDAVEFVTRDLMIPWLARKPLYFVGFVHLFDTGTGLVQAKVTGEVAVYNNGPDTLRHGDLLTVRTPRPCDSDGGVWCPFSSTGAQLPVIARAVLHSTVPPDKVGLQPYSKVVIGKCLSNNVAPGEQMRVLLTPCLPDLLDMDI